MPIFSQGIVTPGMKETGRDGEPCVRVAAIDIAPPSPTRKRRKCDQNQARLSEKALAPSCFLYRNQDHRHHYKTIARKHLN